jgi:hypothetical protein
MSSNDNELFKYTNTSASVALGNGSAVRFGGIFCSSGGGTIAIYDGQSASGTLVVSSFNPIAGVSYPFPALLEDGCFIQVTGAVTFTAFWA